MEEVNREYLKDHVETKESAPHCVYVGSFTDEYREMLGEDAQSVCDELALKLVWHNAFSDNRSFAMKHQVMNLPTLLFFRRGQIECMVGGFVPRSVLLEVATKASRPSVAEISHSISNGDGEYVVIRKSDGTVIREGGKE